MKRLRTISMIAAACTFGLVVAAASAHAADDNKLSIPVAFGRGLNTSQPPAQPINHVMIPDIVRLERKWRRAFSSGRVSRNRDLQSR